MNFVECFLHVTRDGGCGITELHLLLIVLAAHLITRIARKTTKARLL
jgi:hypothetical protein